MKKWLIPLIIFISSFMIYKDNVNAQILSTGIYGLNVYDGSNYWQTSCNNLTPNVGLGICTLSNNFYAPPLRHIYANLYITGGANLSNKTITFNYYISDTEEADVTGIYLLDNNKSYMCEVYTTIYNSGTNIYSVLCPNLPTLTGNGTAIGTMLKNVQTDNDEIGGLSIGISAINGYSDTNSAINDILSKLDTTNSNLDTIKTRLNDIISRVDTTNSNLTDIKSKLDSLNSASTNISNNTEQIKNDIKDSSIDNNNATGTINDLSGQLASDNTITSLLLLPINFINVLIDGLRGECVPYSLGDLWGTEIVLPCVNLYSTFGAIWYMVDTGLSALVIFKMSKYFIRLFNKLTNLKDGGLEEAYS